MTKRILVTGGAGFVGSRLCKRLPDEGNRVVCMDNFSTGSVDNIEAFLGDPAFTPLERMMSPGCRRWCRPNLQSACPASPVHYQADPIGTLKVSVIGALNVLELARRTNIPVLQASTSEVYGDPHVHPQSEDYWGNVNPIGPRACYDEGKRSAETLFFDYHRQYKLPIKVVRIFNTYGPHSIRPMVGSLRPLSFRHYRAAISRSMAMERDGRYGFVATQRQRVRTRA